LGRSPFQCGKLLKSRESRRLSTYRSNSVVSSNQNLGEIPKTLSMRRAISGETGRRPLKIMQRRDRGMPIARATLACFSPIPPRSVRLITSPGRGGLRPVSKSVMLSSRPNVAQRAAEANSNYAAFSGLMIRVYTVSQMRRSALISAAVSSMVIHDRRYQDVR
jgi:hypothetical protein